MENVKTIHVGVKRKRSDTSNAQHDMKVLKDKLSIKLEQNEQELFTILREVATKNNLETTIRVAGGWVRDKLLGNRSNDIDVALDDHTGEQFAVLVNSYLSSRGLKSKTISVIPVNPEQSKHLETATVEVCGLDVDFVNLRSETYQPDSRIPNMKFGTAYEDAMRRDFTVNSLFYNVNNSEIEDFTGMGLDDLQNGIIRTPFPAKITFNDDPLRILRAIRFSSRFNFKMDKNLMETMQEDTIKNGLKHKVSLLRVGKELDGMVQGPSPLQAMALLHKFGLLPFVIPIPNRKEFQAPKKENVIEEKTQQKENSDETKPKKKKKKKKAKPSTKFPQKKKFSEIEITLDDVIQPKDWDVDISLAVSRVAQEIICSSEHVDIVDKSELVLGGILQPLAGTYVELNQGKYTPTIKHILSNSLGIRHNFASNILVACEGSVIFEEMLREPGAFQRLKVARMIYECKEHWIMALAFATASFCVKSLDCSAQIIDEFDRKDHEIYSQCHELFQRKYNLIEKWELTDCWKRTPLFNGKEVMEILKIKKGGPQVGEIMKGMLDFQLLNANATSVEGKEHLKLLAEKHLSV